MLSRDNPCQAISSMAGSSQSRQACTVAHSPQIPIQKLSEAGRYLCSQPPGSCGTSSMSAGRVPSTYGDILITSRSAANLPSISMDPELVQSPWRWPIPLSSPERAILEMLDEVPKGESFHKVDVAFESLANLRPRLLTTLLTLCRSVKTKRLFFVFADKHNHAWRRHIDVSSVDIGKGDRALTPGGRLHPIYRITVPNDLMPKEAPYGP
uniref:Ynd n=2 Tax=Agrobacterium tumefaciens TaxID=358 RepID=Q9R478_AGRTU|nr:ynd [Agrobacterium tumefaciens]